MRVKVLEREGNLLRFFISGVEVAVANALRRIMIAEVPSMAIDDVIVIENDSPMRDELLAHRLGLIPLRTDLDSYVLPEDCDCHSELGCNKCSVTLTLETEAVDSTRTVYSREIKSVDPDIVPVSDAIPVLKLARGQRVRLETYARLGRGKEHARWQPVSACVYTYASTIRIDRKKCDLCERCIEACPKHVLKMNQRQVVVVDDARCNLCRDCVKQCPPEAIEVKRLKDAFNFKIESTGALTPERIVHEAVKILDAKTEEFRGAILALKEGEAA